MQFRYVNHGTMFEVSCLQGIIKYIQASCFLIQHSSQPFSHATASITKFRQQNNNQFTMRPIQEKNIEQTAKCEPWKRQPKTEMSASDQENKSTHTRGYKIWTLFNLDKTKQSANFRHRLLQQSDQQADKQHDNDDNFSLIVKTPSSDIALR